jgi:hypothetical protein
MQAAAAHDRLVRNTMTCHDLVTNPQQSTEEASTQENQEQGRDRTTEMRTNTRKSDCPPPARISASQTDDLPRACRSAAVACKRPCCVLRVAHAMMMCPPVSKEDDETPNPALNL